MVKFGNPRYNSGLVRSNLFPIFTKYMAAVDLARKDIFSATNNLGDEVPSNMDEIEAFNERVGLHKATLANDLTQIGISLKDFHGLMNEMIP